MHDLIENADDPYKYAVSGTRLRGELLWRKSMKLLATGEIGDRRLSRGRPHLSRVGRLTPPPGPGLDQGDIAGHTVTFIGGLHRSGTTMLAKALAEHPDASGFEDTAAIEDEGQFLQSAYPLAAVHGGPGLFGFTPAMHMTEESPGANPVTGRALFEEWAPYWDLSREALIEKSPPNLIKMRFLQAALPGSRFVVVLRHPISSALAVRKWARTPLDSLLRHWLTCHRLARADARAVEHLMVIRYEDLIERPQAELDRLHEFLGLSHFEPRLAIRSEVNDRYLERWRRLSGRSPLHRRHLAALEARYEEAVREFGYSLVDPRWRGTGPPLGPT